MNNNKIQILGNELSILDYNLNKQFLNIKKVIITSDILLESFENSKINEIFKELSKTNNSNYLKILEDYNFEEIFKTKLNDNFYKNLQEKLNLLSENLTDIKLNNYNFMNSVSNSKYTITLRSIGFSKSEYYEERGQILFSIKNLIKDFIKNKINYLNPSQIKKFQIEIYESHEIYKSVFLKKYNNSILLSSSFGFLKDAPIDFLIGPEFYFSIGDDFKFYKNSQTKAILRKQNKLEIKEINVQEKVLSNKELISINELTKDIHDALIEIFINDKGKIKIINLTSLENYIYNNSDNGFFINKSSKNYDSISLLTIRDSLEEEAVNPKYLILRNEMELIEFLDKIYLIKKLDGIILTFNFYNILLDYIGEKFDIDIIFMKQKLNKSLEIKLDREKILINNENLNAFNLQNPFGAILSNKKEDEYLNKLKNIDLSTPKKEEDNFNRNKIENVTTSLISSQNSSINKNSNTFSGINDVVSSNKKKSAIEILAESVLNPKPKVESIKKEENIKSEFLQSSIVMNEITSKDLNPIKNENDIDFNSLIEPKLEEIKHNQIDSKKYENILATKIITTPNIKSKIYFANIESLPQIRDGEIYFMTTSIQNLNNPHLNYIIPIEVENIPENIFILINSIKDFFLINENKNNKYFISLSHIEENLKKKFLINCINKLGIINLIIVKSDLNLLENYINKIDSIFIKDLNDDDEYDEIKNKILSFEKKSLIRNNL